MREGGRAHLIDPMTGLKWEVNDQYCSMFNVSLFLTESNFWVNLQEQNEPGSIDWNFSDSSKWIPFFGPGMAAPLLESPQPEYLNYKPEDEGIGRRLQRELEKAIKDAIENSRTHLRTRWNTIFSSKLQDVLQFGDRNVLQGTVTNYTNFLEEYSQLYPNYRLNGSPFCKTYSNSKEIVDEVLRREVHIVESTQIDFSLGIHVATYPNDFKVVWVFFASLEYLAPTNPRNF